MLQLNTTFTLVFPLINQGVNYCKLKYLCKRRTPNLYMFHLFPWVMNGWWTDVWSQPRRWVTVSPCFLLPELWFWGNCSKCGRIGWKCSQEWRGDHAGAFRHGWPWSSEWQPYTQQGVGALKPLPAHAVPVMLFGGWRSEAFLLHFWWVGKRSMEVVLFIWSHTDTFFFFFN